MSFDFARKRKKSEERKEVALMLAMLSVGRQSAFVGAPPSVKTKTLDEECVRIVLDFLTVEKKGCVEMVFGSFANMMSTMPELRRIPGDIDIQLSVGKQEAILIVSELFAKLEGIDKTLRIDPKKPTIIETDKNGRWERAVDIHYAGEAPEDVLSPLAPTPLLSPLLPPSAFLSPSPPRLSEKERTEEQKLTDTLDFYTMSKTLLESAKRYGEDKSLIEEWERLLKRYVELWEDEIDFDKLEVKKQ